LINLSGHQEVLYTNLEDKPLEEIYFRLYPNIFAGEASLSSVTLNGEEITPDYELARSAVRLVLADALAPGESTVIGMDFNIEMPTEGSGNYGLFGYIDGILVLHKFYPVIPVYDDEGWNVEIPPPSGDVSYFDASFYLVQVTAPEDLILAASGVEIERFTDGEQQVVTYANGPARGFYLAASNLYTVISDTIDEVTVNSYYLLGSEKGARNALDVTIDSLDSFSNRFGHYPYTEFDIVSTPMQALGMEYPGITAIYTGLYDPNGEVSGLPAPIWLESAVAHEVGHMWFYNTVGNDQVDEPWVDESIVQYVTGLYYADVYGIEAFEGFKDSWLDRWSRVEFEDIPIGLPVAEYEGKEYGAIVYGRGPLFIDALAEEMGKEVFNEFLRDYYQTHKWGIGTAQNFRELAEEHCECDLTALFEEWVY
jgi:aminopeptidase N